MASINPASAIAVLSTVKNLTSSLSSYKEKKSANEASIASAAAEYQASQNERKNLLKSALAKQRALYASQGLSTNDGSAAAIEQGLLNDFNQDESLSNLNYENKLKKLKTSNQSNQASLQNSYYNLFI